MGVQILKVGSTDIFLENYEKKGQGKITISDTYNGAYSYVWGAMGSTIEQFICEINPEYFAHKLCNTLYQFCPKQTAKNVRKFIREEIPFWTFMPAQKELRKQIKKIESLDSGDEFIRFCSDIHDEVYCTEMSWDENREFEEKVKDIFSCEPWNFIGETTTREYNWLYDLHKKLKKQLETQTIEV